jgi:hypothetical protein
MKQSDLGIGNSSVLADEPDCRVQVRLRPRLPANARLMWLRAAVFIVRCQSTADTFVQLSELTASGFMESPPTRAKTQQRLFVTASKEE